MSNRQPVALHEDVPDAGLELHRQKDAVSCSTVDRTALACEDCDKISFLGNCHGFAVFPASQAKDFYRGYALVAVPATMLAVVAITYFAF
ncbi:hypothetical protein [Acidovorax sp. CF316]|uniref:hypothetical protein n=1 Tax=Acidovorax sp. CF316 TaxID=1144317 RepID=UPI000D3A269A|nr:hypothetical protein [Acidovorax sp. CF316]